MPYTSGKQEKLELIFNILSFAIPVVTASIQLRVTTRTLAAGHNPRLMKSVRNSFVSVFLQTFLCGAQEWINDPHLITGRLFFLFRFVLIKIEEHGL